DDADGAVARHHINAPRREDRRGAVAIGVETPQVNLLAGVCVETVEQAVVPGQINQPVLHQGGGDLWRSFPAAPQLEVAARLDHSLCPRFDRYYGPTLLSGYEKHFRRGDRRRDHL